MFVNSLGVNVGAWPTWRRHHLQRL